MDFSIYTFGGGEILGKILNGIAILFKSDNPYFSSLSRFVATSSLFWLGTKAIFKSQPLDLIKNWMIPYVFLVSIFFGVSSSVHIIDEVDPDQRYTKIDNVPFGIACIASLTSTVSKHVTESIETVFTSPTSKSKYSTTGMMFGARLASMARNITIQDPVSRQNLREFMGRCFMWPYVFTNITPGKKAALETEDILGFISQNAHPLLGMYWQSPNGSQKYIDCKECVSNVRSLLNVENERGLSNLASKVFSRVGDQEIAKKKLLSYFGDGWQKITSKTESAANIVQQSILINSYKDSLDSQRDSLLLGRIDPDLVRMNAARSQAQQNATWLVKAAQAGQEIPTLHMTLFGLALMLSVIMAPLAFLPNGLKFVLTWGKIMTWLATWPIFYAVLDGLGEMMAARAVASNAIGIGDGLSIATQSLLSESAFDSYCWIQSMQLSIPVISWALVTGGGYAMTQIAGSFTQGIEAGAAKAGSEMVDGNTTFDSQTLHHRSVANSQIAQQQLGSSLSYGSRFDDGQMAKLTATNGNEIFQEHQTQLASNVNTTSMLSQVAGINAALHQTAASQYSQSEMQSAQEGFQKFYSVLDSVTSNKTLADTFGTTESAQAQTALNEAKNIIESFSKENGVSADRATAIVMQASAGLSAGIDGSSLNDVSKKMGISLSGHGNMNSTFTGREQELIKKFEQSGKTKDFAQNLSKGMQFMDDHKGSITDSSVKQGLDQSQSSFAESRSYNQQKQNSLNSARMWSATASESEHRNIASSGNINRDVLTYVADQKFGGNTEAASMWQTTNQPEYLEMAGKYMRARSNNTRIDNSISLNSNETGDFFKNNHLSNDINDKGYNKLKSSTDIGVSNATISDGLSHLKQDVKGNLDNIDSKFEASDFEKASSNLEDIHSRSQKKSTARIARRKLTRNNSDSSLG
jgi:hypothetical protein